MLLRYDLEAKAYEDLRDPNVRSPRILVLVVVPGDEVQWLGQSDDHLLIRHCAYWLSLVGRPPTTAKKTVRVAVPRANVFSVPALQGIVQRVQRGEVL